MYGSMYVWFDSRIHENRYSGAQFQGNSGKFVDTGRFVHRRTRVPRKPRDSSWKRKARGREYLSTGFTRTDHWHSACGYLYANTVTCRLLADKRKGKSHRRRNGFPRKIANAARFIYQLRNHRRFLITVSQCDKISHPVKLLSVSPCFEHVAHRFV